MPAPDPPAWRRAFDAVELRLGGPLGTATSSTEFQRASQRLGRMRRAVLRPVGNVVSGGLHLLGLPAGTDLLALRRQLADVQREVLALRRDVSTNDQQRREP